MSSVIVTGGKWKLYTGKNLKASVVKTVTRGTYYFEAGDMVESIE